MKFSVEEITQKFLLPRNEVEIIFGEFLNLKKEVVLSRKYFELEAEQFEKLKFILKKIKNGFPVNYFLGKKEFLSTDFWVNKSTLIPRPETELLVEIANLEIKNMDVKTVFDVGTGSGIIAISLKKMNPDVEVIAIDNNKKTLVVAEKNAKLQKSNPKFFRSDLLKSPRLKKFNPELIVANLPYIPTQNYFALEKNIYFEPKKALLGGKTGLRFIKKLLLKTKKLDSCRNLKKIILEIDSRKQALILSSWAKKEGFETEKLISDYSGLTRIIVLRKV